MKKLAHISDLFAPIDFGEDPIRLRPREDLDQEEIRKFWRFQGHFPNDFARAIVEILPEGKTFDYYDHLNNILKVTDEPSSI
jgi:hypothetical protein